MKVLSNSRAVAAMWSVAVVALLGLPSWALVLAAGGLAIALAEWMGSQDEEPSTRFWEGAFLQAFAVALSAGHLRVAAVCFAVAMFRFSRIDDPRAPEWRKAFTLFAALALTLFGWIPMKRTKLMPAPVAAKGNAPGAADDMHSGIVLRPPRPPHVTLIAPPTPRMARGRGMAKPLVIPFSGEYWLYYWPLDRPPRSALRERGDPTEFKFTTSPMTRLNMEARQTLNAPIDVDCCDGIEVNVTSTDPMPGTVALELLLRDSKAQDVKPRSLGEVEVMASGPLRFAMPALTKPLLFDEMIVVYRLRVPRMQRSASVSVDSFKLLPR
ncbi:MAG TPA: hypothetical protein VER03_10700 [Bryobacteraceae bacterium]|nr:hypothetical protein [Bryobacteraceae bacterium]